MKNPLPKNARRVFNGKIFKVYQWPQKMFDGSLDTFEKIKRPDTVQVIATIGKKILIQKQTQPDHPAFLSLPGGRVDKNETPLKAGKRELEEETGFVSKNWQLLKKYHPYNKIIWTSYTFLAKNCYKQTKPRLDPGEKIKSKLISFNDFILLSENDHFYEKELRLFLYKVRIHPRLKKLFYQLLFS